MALPKCMKCDSTRWQVQTVDPMGAQYKVNALTCASCGSVAGVLEYYSAGALLKKQEKVLKDMSDTVDRIHRKLRQA